MWRRRRSSRRSLNTFTSRAGGEGGERAREGRREGGRLAFGKRREENQGQIGREGESETGIEGKQKVR